MITADLFLKGKVVGREVRILNAKGEIVFRRFDIEDKGPLNNIREAIKFIDEVLEERRVGIIITD